MPLREQYEAAVRKIACGYPAAPNGSFEIPPSATKEACLAYTLYHVCGQRLGGSASAPHYRYDRYWNALHDWLVRVEAPFDGPHEMQIALNQMLPGEKRKSPESSEAEDAEEERVHLVHLDIGSGPGLFSWVAHDYFLECRNVEVSLFALDRCPNMVRLARALWQRMDTHDDLSADDDWPRIHRKLARAVSGPDGDSTILVTIGHLLVQIVDDERSTRDVARILADCAGLTSALRVHSRCFVVAADAHTDDRRERFERAWSRLQVTLREEHAVSLSFNPLPSYSQAYGEAMSVPTAGRRRG